MTKYVQVIVATGSRMTDRLFTYEVPNDLTEDVRCGSNVLVPFGRGNRKVEGVVIAFTKKPTEYATKALLGFISDRPPLSDEAMALIRYMVSHYLSDYTSALSAVSPPGKAESYVPKIVRFFQLTEEGFSANVSKSASRQKMVLDALKEGSIEARILLKLTGAQNSTLSALEKKGWIEQTNKRVGRFSLKQVAKDHKRKLNEEQKAVYDRIAKKSGRYLICGVTGSGKTEIYLQLAEKVLEDKKECIILVPEIALTPQTIARFQSRFGESIAILHSRLSVQERYEEWEKIYEGKVRIAIGARSAVFAPFQNLGLIVIDEEHEMSYTAEKNPKYRTHDIAAFRCAYHDATLVLGSATPSVRTLYEAEMGMITRLNLTSRVSERALPTIHVTDMREELKDNNRSMFSRKLQEAIREALKKKEQIILFLNKRGHTSFIFCRSCGYVYRCDACDVSMTWHKRENRLICHYCGREKAYSRKCPDCGSEYVKEFGAGTQMLEEETRKLFPKAVIVRADADTMGKKGAYDRIYEKMLSGDIDILLGTQMIAKGFDFPNVSVVGIVSADISLNLPDIRAAERTFQLITQVAGRAGRGDVPGKVIIQTYKPAHYAIRYAQAQDIDGFYQEEIALRRENRYPPTVWELAVSLSGLNRNAVLAMGKKVRSVLNTYSDLRIDGPTPSVIERINRRYRFGILVRYDDVDFLRQLGRTIIEEFPSTPDVRIGVTVDPQSIY